MSPAVETRLGPDLVIIREHIKDIDLAGESRFGCGRDFSRVGDLFARWEQRCAIKKRPAVELRIGQLDSFGSQRFRQFNHLRQAIDVPSVNHKIEAERNAGRPNFPSNVQLMPMRARASDFIGQAGLVGLETQLNGIEACIAQQVHAFVIQADAAGDEIGVKVCSPRGTDKLGQVRSNKWFASGKTDLQNAECSGFTNDPFPFVGSEFAVAVADDLRVARRFAQRSGYRVGAVRTMQRAPVTNFGEQCVWTRRNHVSSINLRCSKPARVSRTSIAIAAWSAS